MCEGWTDGVEGVGGSVVVYVLVMGVSSPALVCMRGSYRNKGARALAKHKAATQMQKIWRRLVA